MNPQLPSALIRIGAVCLLASLAAACSGEAKSTPPPRPTPPAGWVTVQTTTADVRLTLPSDVVPFHVEDTIVANLPPGADGVIPLEIQAVGPSAGMLPREANESLEGWVDRQVHGGLPADLRGAQTSETVLLPAGRAQRVSTEIAPGSPDPRLVVVWAMPLDGRIGYLVVNASPQVAEERAADLELIAQLVEFGQ